MKWKLAILGGAAAVAASVATPMWLADASASASAPPCRSSDVSFYYGGAFEGMGRRAFDITLLAHDGVRCRLLDRPLITFQRPPGAKRKVHVNIGGRGGSLILTPALPLHTTVQFFVADRPANTARIATLTLRMPGGGFTNPEPVLYPGTQLIAANIGIQVRSWSTGIGQGQEASSF